MRRTAAFRSRPPRCGLRKCECGLGGAERGPDAYGRVAYLLRIGAIGLAQQRRLEPDDPVPRECRALCRSAADRRRIARFSHLFEGARRMTAIGRCGTMAGNSRGVARVNASGGDIDTGGEAGNSGGRTMPNLLVIAGVGETPSYPKVRKIGLTDLKQALAGGIDDFSAMPTHVLFLGILYPLVGLFLACLTFGYEVVPLLFPLASG